MSVAADLIARFEGVRLNAYHDAAGYPTIGIGHKLSDTKWDDLSKYPPITYEQALSQYDEHLVSFRSGVNRLFPEIKDENKIAALTSFAFNLGLGALQKSLLRTLIRSEAHIMEIVSEWCSWRKAGGKILLGLERRRLAEVCLFYKKDIEK